MNEAEDYWLFQLWLKAISSQNIVKREGKKKRWKSFLELSRKMCYSSEHLNYIFLFYFFHRVVPSPSSEIFIFREWISENFFFFSRRSNFQLAVMIWRCLSKEGSKWRKGNISGCTNQLLKVTFWSLNCWLVTVIFIWVLSLWNFHLKSFFLGSLSKSSRLSARRD